MLLNNLAEQKLIHPPKWLIENTNYLVMMGSQAYGCDSGSSDTDIYGWVIPPKEIIFPHLNGHIEGFGKGNKEVFHQWQEHHIVDPNKDKEYDFSVYNIVDYFQLCMMNNPNMLDSLFVPERCVLHCSEIARMVREQRKIFLHKGAFQKFSGYAYSQLAKIRSKEAPVGKRKELVDKFGYDVKFAYHLIRLLEECRQILVEHDLNIERNREQLKSIRRGEWTLDQIVERFQSEEKALSELYNTSDLRLVPDEEEIKKLLMKCLEHHYGSLKKAIVMPNAEKKALDEIAEIIERLRKQQA